MRERGPLSVQKLNASLQEVLNPATNSRGQPSVKGLKHTFRENDKVNALVMAVLIGLALALISQLEVPRRKVLKVLSSFNMRCFPSPFPSSAL